MQLQQGLKKLIEKVFQNVFLAKVSGTISGEIANKNHLEIQFKKICKYSLFVVGKSFLAVSCFLKCKENIIWLLSQTKL